MNAFKSFPPNYELLAFSQWILAPKLRHNILWGQYHQRGEYDTKNRTFFWIEDRNFQFARLFIEHAAHIS